MNFIIIAVGIISMGMFIIVLEKKFANFKRKWGENY